MTITKGMTIKITTPQLDDFTPESIELATVKTVFKTGNIKVVSEYGYGYTITPGFFNGGGTVEVVR